MKYEPYTPLIAEVVMNVQEKYLLRKTVSTILLVALVLAIAWLAR